MKIGERIKELRESKGMKRPALAAMIGVEPNTLYRYETGAFGIKDDIKDRIAKALGVTVAFLMGETNDPNSPNPNFTETSKVEECKTPNHSTSMSSINIETAEPVTDKRAFEISVRDRKVRVEFKVNDPPEFIKLMIEEARQTVFQEQQSEKISSGLAFEPAVGGDTSN